MASKYRDRILKSSGVSSRKVESDYAKKLMMGMGWTEGKGLGKKEHGVVECVQVRRREENLGLGIKSASEESFDWKNQWWNTAYNDSIKKLRIIPNKKIAEESSSSDSSSDESSSDSSETPVLKHKKIQKAPKKRIAAK